MRVPSLLETEGKDQWTKGIQPTVLKDKSEDSKNLGPDRTTEGCWSYVHKILDGDTFRKRGIVTPHISTYGYETWHLSDDIAIDADGSNFLTVHPPTKILYCGCTLRHGIPPCSILPLLQSIHPPLHCNLSVWSLRATRATHLYCPYREQYHLTITSLPLLKCEAVQLSITT